MCCAAHVKNKRSMISFRNRNVREQMCLHFVHYLVLFFFLYIIRSSVFGYLFTILKKIDIEEVPIHSITPHMRNVERIFGIFNRAHCSAFDVSLPREIEEKKLREKMNLKDLSSRKRKKKQKILYVCTQTCNLFSPSIKFSCPFFSLFLTRLREGS